MSVASVSVKAWLKRKPAPQSRSTTKPNLEPVPVTRKTGEEPFYHAGGTPIEVRLREFRIWTDSDLVGNAVRGRLAEYLVAMALKVDKSTVRRDWTPSDLETSDKLAIEVKSASYIVQTWAQRRDAKIVFDIAKTLGWDQDLAVWGTTRRRHAHVYLFALLAERNRAKVDPLNLDQWAFYVLRTREIDAKLGNQKTLSLGRLEKLALRCVRLADLVPGIRGAYPDTGRSFRGIVLTSGQSAGGYSED